MPQRREWLEAISEERTAIISFAVLIAAMLLLRGEIKEKAHYIFLIYFIVMLINRIDSRYSIGAALILLLYTAVLLAQKKEDFANQVAIYAYYFLVGGVVLQLIEYIREGGEKVEEREEKPEKVPETVAVPRRKIKVQMKKRRKGKPRFIAIASGKGGVGKTTLTANLGVALSRLGTRVITVDMDIAMPNLEVIMGVTQPPVGLIDVIDGRLDVKRVMFLGCDGVKVIPSGVILNGFTATNVKKIKTALGKIKDGDFVLLDMPPGREAIRVLKQGQEMLLVVNPEKASVLDALNLKVIAEKKRLNILGAVVNRAGGYPRELRTEDIEEVLELDVLATIPEDKKVMECYSEEVPFMTRYENMAPSREILKLASLLAGEGVPEQAVQEMTAVAPEREEKVDEKGLEIGVLLAKLKTIIGGRIKPR
jgi:septum site-determining protein MinD